MATAKKTVFAINEQIGVKKVSFLCEDDSGVHTHKLTIEDTKTGDKVEYVNPSESELELHVTVLNRAMLFLRTRKS